MLGGESDIREAVLVFERPDSGKKSWVGAGETYAERCWVKINHRASQARRPVREFTPKHY